jgi:hypothetical protein
LIENLGLFKHLTFNSSFNFYFTCIHEHIDHTLHLENFIPFIGCVNRLKLRNPNNYIFSKFVKCKRGHKYLQIFTNITHFSQKTLCKQGWWKHLNAKLLEKCLNSKSLRFISSFKECFQSACYFCTNKSKHIINKLFSTYGKKIKSKWIIITQF